MARFERELLEAVAKEMNKVMGLTPAMDFAMMEDGTLLDTIVMEATGRGVVKDAVRADDFESADPDKMLFSKRAHAFFVEASVWDDKAKRVIMPKAAAEKPAAAPVEKKTAKPAAKAEAAAQENMEAGEDEPELPLEPEPESKPAKVDRKKEPNAASARKAGKTVTKTTPAAEQVAEKKEEVMKTTKAGVSRKTAVAKKRAAKAVPAKKASVKKVNAAPVNLDAYGFREGSTTSKAVAFLAGGKHTMAEAKAKFGSSFYSALKKIKATGGKVVANDDSTFKISAK